MCLGKGEREKGKNTVPHDSENCYIETITYQTSKEQLPSGYVRRDSNYLSPIIKLNLGDRNLDSDEVERLLGFFWCAQGQARLWTLKHQGKSYLGRFAQDNLSLRFEGYDQSTECKIFYLSGLSFESTNAFSGLLNFIVRIQVERIDKERNCGRVAT